MVVASSGGKARPQERERNRFVYDSNDNLVEIRTFHPNAKLGDKVVRLTKLVYDTGCHLIKTIPNYDTDYVVSEDLGLT